MEDELYVFAENQLGACIYSNALVRELELFRWRDDRGALAIEPLRSVFVSDGKPAEMKPRSGIVVRYALTTERTCWDRDSAILRLDPKRGIGTRYARGTLSEPTCETLERHIGFLVTADASIRVGGAS